MYFALPARLQLKKTKVELVPVLGWIVPSKFMSLGTSEYDLLGNSIFADIISYNLYQGRNIVSFLIWGHVWQWEGHFSSFKNRNKHLLNWIPLVFFSIPVSSRPFSYAGYLLSLKMFLMLYVALELLFLLGICNRNTLLYALLYQLILSSMRVGQWYHDSLLSRFLFS